MAYVEPTVDDFRLNYPEFNLVCDDLVQVRLDRTVLEVGDTWNERDRAEAQLLLAAHRLAVEGEPARSNAINNGNSASGPQSGEPTMLKIGDISMSYAGSTNIGATSMAQFSGIGGDYYRTPYGIRYYELLRRNFSPIQVV